MKGWSNKKVEKGGSKAAALSDTSEKFLHKKSLGQNFLTSDIIPKKMCDTASLEVGEVVLEIGPGTGALTKELLTRGVKVIAVETDSRAVDSLKETFSNEIVAGNLTLHHSDARKIDFEALQLSDKSFKVVANIPYYLSGLLFRTFLESDIQPSTLVFLVQKEVAERITREKKESLLSVSVKIFGEPTYICTVKRGHFNPPPKVDSAIIAITNISRDRLKDIDIKAFFEFLHIGFGQKRKQLLGNMSKKYDRAVVLGALRELNLEEDVRAEDVPFAKWPSFATHLL